MAATAAPAQPTFPAGLSKPGPQAERPRTYVPPPERKFTFQCVAGGYHVEWELVRDEESDQQLYKEIKYGRGRPVMKDVHGNDVGGEIVRTNVNLGKKHNHPGFPTKFKDLSADDLTGTVAELQAEKAKTQSAENRLRKLVSIMSAKELLDYCKDEQIDPKGESTKNKLERIVLEAAGLTPNAQPATPAQ